MQIDRSFSTNRIQVRPHVLRNHFKKKLLDVYNPCQVLPTNNIIELEMKNHVATAITKQSVNMFEFRKGAVASKKTLNRGVAQLKKHISAVSCPHRAGQESHSDSALSVQPSRCDSIDSVCRLRAGIVVAASAAHGSHNFPFCFAPRVRRSAALSPQAYTTL